MLSLAYRIHVALVYCAYRYIFMCGQSVTMVFLHVHNFSKIQFQTSKVLFEFSFIVKCAPVSEWLGLSCTCSIDKLQQSRVFEHL